jgi:hypothetical protein
VRLSVEQVQALDQIAAQVYPSLDGAIYRGGRGGPLSFRSELIRTAIGAYLAHAREPREALRATEEK